MAGSLAPKDMILYDNFPGVASPNTPFPANGLTQKDTTALYPVGMKLTILQDGSVGKLGSSVANKGYYTVMYSGLYDYTNAADVSAGKGVTLACGSDKARGGIFLTPDMSGGNYPTAGKNFGPVAYPCVSFAPHFSTPEYGWFWVGGVCPNHDVSDLDVTGFLLDSTGIWGGAVFGMDYDATVVKIGLLEYTIGSRVGFALGDASV